MLDALINEKEHPLIRETKRECLEDQWAVDGVIEILNNIRSGRISVREVYTDVPSPMSLPLQWQAEAAEMYEYSPTAQGIRQTVYEELKHMDQIKPSAEDLSKQQERKKLPENKEQLHSLLMIEGDLIAGELTVPVEWLESLAESGFVLYREPGIWIAAEQQEEYEKALGGEDAEAGAHIVRRMLYYRGGQTSGGIQERYFFSDAFMQKILSDLMRVNSVVSDEDIYYHTKLYDRARNAAIRERRLETATQPPKHYAALMAERADIHAPAEEQLRKTVEQYCGSMYPVKFWETILLSRRVKNYSEAMLDRLLSEGDYFWKMTTDGSLCFCRYDDIDWEAPFPKASEYLTGDERLLYEELKKRGASFLKFLTDIPKEGSAQETLLKLAEKGLVYADSFVPVRQWQNREKIKKAVARQRMGARVMALSAGRWDIVRPLKSKSGEDLLAQYFNENPVLCRETFRKAAAVGDGGKNDDGRNGDERNGDRKNSDEAFSWRKALEILRIWEYTGRVRRGYYVEGMSGAQFIRKEEYEGVTAGLKSSENKLSEKNVIWLNASDPAQIWGKVLQPSEGREFMNLPGTAVALCAGEPVAVLERQGKVLRVFGTNSKEETELLVTVMTEFVKEFQRKKLFPEQKRLIVKDYSKWAEEALKRAGFMKEMQDYVLYR